MPPDVVTKFAEQTVTKCLNINSVKNIVVNAFHWVYYTDSPNTWNDSEWRGVQALKNPLDMWIYQEIITETQPDVIIETGTAHGGSARYLGDLCELIGDGRVISIDIDPRATPEHQRVEYLTGSSTSDEILEAVNQRIGSDETAMVILDSDHRYGHVIEEMECYADVVTPGNYLIVEDTNINGNPVRPTFGSGPYEAVEEFLSKDGRFARDAKREKFYFTFNPGGYLKHK